MSENIYVLGHFLLFSAVDFIPLRKLFSVNGLTLLGGYTECPVSFRAAAGNIQSCVASKPQKILNREDHKACVTCQHGPKNGVIAIIPILVRVAKIGQKAIT